ncbi:hypothetical protein GCM10029963_41470 [Micromonospora andamanensis]
MGWLYSSIAIGSLLAGLVSGWIGRVRRQGLVLVLAVVGWGSRWRWPGWLANSGWWSSCWCWPVPPTWSARWYDSRCC